MVRDDTVRRLGMRNPTVRTESFNRPNLTYEIRPKKAGILDEVRQSTLINTCLMNETKTVIRCFHPSCSLDLFSAANVWILRDEARSLVNVDRWVHMVIEDLTLKQFLSRISI